MEKSKDFQLFMTQNDEQQFCEELRGYNPNIFFLDISPSSEADISKRLYTSVVNSSSSFFSIVNFDLMTMEELKTRYKKYGKYTFVHILSAPFILHSEIHILLHLFPSML